MIPEGAEPQARAGVVDSAPVETPLTTQQLSTLQDLAEECKALLTYALTFNTRSMHR